MIIKHDNTEHTVCPQCWKLIELHIRLSLEDSVDALMEQINDLESYVNERDV